MTAIPSPTRFGLLLGLSFFLGLAFEDFFARAGATERPGGVRTFPLLALAGGLLYLLDQKYFIPFTGGLLVLGALLLIFYRRRVSESDEQGDSSVGLIIPLLNIHAYLLGAIALATPSWVAVGATVAAVLLLTARERLHMLARRLDIKEIITAGQFLVLTGIILPLLPDQPVTRLTSITPRQVWLALVVVCTISYLSYLAQRYWAAAAGGLWMAAIGGLYSSTATTVVLARQAKSKPEFARYAQIGITLATGLSYLRFLAIIAVFNLALARELAAPLTALALIAFLACGLQYWRTRSMPREAPSATASGNPLELGAATIFSGLFILISVLSTWVRTEFGLNGLYSLAALVGVTDIDPFVLNLAQGGTSGVSVSSMASAILIASSSNNLVKAGYAAFFAGGRQTLASAVILAGLAALGVAMAIWL